MGERSQPAGSASVPSTAEANSGLDRLFVYATLREGQAARSLLAGHIARSVNASTTGALYASPAGYAGLVEADAPMRVIGELVWLTDLATAFSVLDAYEGEEFARVVKQVRLETGEVVGSWIYTLAAPEMIKHGSLIAHGDWLRHLTETRSA